MALTSKICHVYYTEILHLESDGRARSKSTLKSQIVVVTDEDYDESPPKNQEKVTVTSP